MDLFVVFPTAFQKVVLELLEKCNVILEIQVQNRFPFDGNQLSRFSFPIEVDSGAAHAQFPPECLCVWKRKGLFVPFVFLFLGRLEQVELRDALCGGHGASCEAIKSLGVLGQMFGVAFFSLIADRDFH